MSVTLTSNENENSSRFHPTILLPFHFHFPALSPTLNHENDFKFIATWCSCCCCCCRCSCFSYFCSNCCCLSCCCCSNLFFWFFLYFQSIIRPLWREKKAQSPHTFSSEERAEIIFDNVVREQSLTAPSNKTDTSKMIKKLYWNF